MSIEKLGLQDDNRKIYLQELLEENDKEVINLTEEEVAEKLENEEKSRQGIDKKILKNGAITERETEEFSEQELKRSGHGWENYTHIIKVKETDEIYEDFQDLEKPLILGYDKSGNFVANTIGENGEPVRSQIIHEGRSVMKEVMHINDNGEQVKEMVPSAVMDTRNDNLKLSVKIGKYGYTEAQKIQITHDNKWVATDIDKEGNYDKTYDVKYETDLTKQGTCGNEELAQNYEMQQETGDQNVELDEIKHAPNNNIESVKRQIADIALENYNKMSAKDLKIFILSEIQNKLGDYDINTEDIYMEIKETVEDEARFPTRGEVDVDNE